MFSCVFCLSFFVFSLVVGSVSIASGLICVTFFVSSLVAVVKDSIVKACVRTGTVPV